MSLFWKFLFIAALPGAALALDIRAYDPARHDRFVPGPEGPLPNPTSYYNAANYTAVGFGPSDGRQFALVTPEHVLFAGHYAFGGSIRFTAADGSSLDRTISTVTPVPNSTGGNSDIVIIRLSSPIPPSFPIKPFPYLNLAEGGINLKERLVTFGQSLRAGGATITRFSDFSSPAQNIGDTRVFEFYYSTTRGSADDAIPVTGDSGSPTFYNVSGKPALVGIHLAAGTTSTGARVGLDSFIPHYSSPINDLLNPSGYQLIPAYPNPVTLTATHPPQLLRKASPGTLTFRIANTSASSATNPTIDLTFPPGALPGSITAPGFIVSPPSNGVFRLHRADLPTNSSIDILATYPALPDQPAIPVSLLLKSDGSSDVSQNFSIPLSDSFAAFVANVPQKSPADDPDSDRLPNLVEYAFGGDPSVPTPATSDGIGTGPVGARSENSLIFTYPVRKDAAARGIEYIPELSTTLLPDSWSAALPPGSITTTFPCSDPGCLFDHVSITVPSPPSDPLFFRVTIALDE